MASALLVRHSLPKLPGQEPFMPVSRLLLPNPLKVNACSTWRVAAAFPIWSPNCQGSRAAAELLTVPGDAWSTTIQHAIILNPCRVLSVLGFFYLQDRSRPNRLKCNFWGRTFERGFGSAADLRVIYEPEKDLSELFVRLSIRHSLTSPYCPFVLGVTARQCPTSKESA